MAFQYEHEDYNNLYRKEEYCCHDWIREEGLYEDRDDKALGC
jgi:hypothetical protein